MTSIQKLNALGQSVWYDNVERSLLESGHIAHLIEAGVSGVTSNPSIFEKAITKSSAYDSDIQSAVQAGKSTEEIYDILAFSDITTTAKLLRPIYERTDGQDGYVSIEVPPALAKDTEATIAEARRIHATLGQPNVMIKVPATPEGVPAIRTLIGEGIPVNVTLIFSVQAYETVIEAYLQGLEERAQKGESLKVASVASFFVSRVDTLVDKLVEERHLSASLLGKTAVANAKTAYQLFKTRFTATRFEKLAKAGARVQRPLWASTSTKNPDYSQLLYVENLVGRDTVNTMPPQTLDVVLTTQDFHETVGAELSDAEKQLQALEDGGISLTEVTDELLAQGLKLFEESFENLLENLKDKAQALKS